VTGLRECRPGGSCPDCNPPPIYCQECCENEIENPGDVCDACLMAPDECDWCGKPLDEDQTRFCSKGCARAAESDHA
jgi:hypothetical protein